MKLDLIEPIFVLVTIFIAQYQVSRLSSKVNKLKRDADNFGEILGTETAKIRKTKKEGTK